MQKLKGVQKLKGAILVALGWGIVAAMPATMREPVMPGNEAVKAGNALVMPGSEPKPVRAGEVPGDEAKSRTDGVVPGEGTESRTDVVMQGDETVKAGHAGVKPGNAPVIPGEGVIVGGRGTGTTGTASGKGTAGAGSAVKTGTGAGVAGPAKEALSWMNLDEAAGKLQKEQRPVLIDLYTSWCGWCKQMDKKTYSNKQVAQYLQDKFYPVKLDAETRAVLNWKGKAYRFNADYKSNEFAVYLTHGQLEFPTTIIIPPGGEPQAIPGYMEPKELELLVKYFGEGNYNKVSFDVYQKSFKASW